MSDAIERWLPLPGYDGYEVSSFGRVRSLDRLVPHKDGRVRRQRGKILKGGVNRYGRRHVTLCAGERYNSKTIAPLVLETFVGPRPDGMECCHNDGNPLNDRLENLRWDTKSANQLDQVLHGRHPFATRTVCPRGHRLAEPNLIASQLLKGSRSCKACMCAHGKLRTAKRRGESIDFQAVSDAHYAQIMQETHRNVG